MIKEKVSGKEELLLLMEQAKRDGKKHISFSEFDLYNKCGHKHLVFKYLGLDKEPPSIHLAFGDAVHASIEETLEKSTGTQERVEFFRKRFRKNMDETMADQPGYREMDAFMEQGVNILSKIDFVALLAEYELVSVEEALYEHIHGVFHFKGFIDLVLKHKKTGRYLILDWKTSTTAWILKYKLADRIFLMQMKLYKYFWARKNNVDLSLIDVKYMVLNRLADKKDPKKGFGDIQEVAMSSTMEDIKEALTLMAETIKKIHIQKVFIKAKMTDDNACRFCKYNDGKHPLCNSNEFQYVTLLKEHGIPILGK